MALRKSCKERGRWLTITGITGAKSGSTGHLHLWVFSFSYSVWIAGLLCSWLVSPASQSTSFSSQLSLQCSSILLGCPPPWQVALSSPTEKGKAFFDCFCFCCYAFFPMSCLSVNLGLGGATYYSTFYKHPEKPYFVGPAALINMLIIFLNICNKVRRLAQRVTGLPQCCWTWLQNNFLKRIPFPCILCH